MRPKLKGDAYWVPVEDGAYFLSNERSLHLKGRHVAQWIDRLAPHLDGRTDLDDLVAGLQPDKQHMVRTLVTALADAGYVDDSGQDAPHSLTDEELRLYASEITYLEYFGHSAARRFQDFRESDVVLLGAGPVFDATVRAAAHLGLRRVRTVACPDGTTAHDPGWQAWEGDTAQQFVHHVLEEDGRDALAAAIGDASVVLHVCTLSAVDRAMRVNGLCAEDGRTLVQGVLDGGTAWLGPVAAAGSDRNWASAWRRRCALTTPAGADDGGGYHTDDFGTGPMAAIVGNYLAFACFRYVTGGEAGTEHMVEVDLETLRTTVHRFLPHPLAAPAGPEGEAEFLARLERLDGGERLDEETFSHRAVDCFDPRLGVFASLDEDELTQLPLNVARVRLSDPMGMLGAAPTVVAAGTDYSAARRRATRRAIEVYCSIAMDHRRLLPSREPQGTPALAWGLDLRTGKPRLVDATLAFPALTRPGTAYRRPAGLASGLTWAGAVERGLLELCAARAVETLNTGDARYPRLDLRRAPLDELGGRYLHTLDTAGVDVAVYELGNLTGTVVLGVCTGPDTVGYVAGQDPVHTLTEVLELAVLAYQARAYGQPDCAPPAVAPLPPERRGPVLDGWRYPAHRPPEPEDLLRTLVDALCASGRSPVAVPLDHDPAVNRMLPYVVQVAAADE
jgi:putative thiazole-containing bacteriocin maturation protein